MKVGKYVVISTCGSDDCYISCKGVTGIYSADTLKQAQEILDDIVKEFMDNIIEHEIKKNIPYGDDLCECDSINHSSYFWGNTMAWICAHLENWERVEIFEFDEKSDKFINLSMP